MDQQKIGRFLKTLRKEKSMTQEQLAEKLGVSNRSVSRWETGANLPDLDILIQLADHYGVELREILDGEKRTHDMDKEMEETVLKVADYSNQEKMLLTKRIHWIFLAGVAAFVVYMILDIRGLTEAGIYEDIASVALGMVLGILLLGVLFTSRYMAKVRAFKIRLLNREK